MKRRPIDILAIIGISGLCAGILALCCKVNNDYIIYAEKSN